MEETSSYLFVYGTLLNERNKFGAWLKSSCRFYQKGKFKGKLYDIAEYPGAIFQPESSTYVYGSIFIMGRPGETLRIMDDYEGFGKDHPQPNEFVRELIGIETEGQLIKCWVYLYNCPVDESKRIISGEYFFYKR